MDLRLATAGCSSLIAVCNSPFPSSGIFTSDGALRPNLCGQAVRLGLTRM